MIGSVARGRSDRGHGRGARVDDEGLLTRQRLVRSEAGQGQDEVRAVGVLQARAVQGERRRGRIVEVARGIAGLHGVGAGHRGGVRDGGAGRFAIGGAGFERERGRAARRVDRRGFRERHDETEARAGLVGAVEVGGAHAQDARNVPVDDEGLLAGERVRRSGGRQDQSRRVAPDVEDRAAVQAQRARRRVVKVARSVAALHGVGAGHRGGVRDGGADRVAIGRARFQTQARRPDDRDGFGELDFDGQGRAGDEGPVGFGRRDAEHGRCNAVHEQVLETGQGLGVARRAQRRRGRVAGGVLQRASENLEGVDAVVVQTIRRVTGRHGVGTVDAVGLGDLAECEGVVRARFEFEREDRADRGLDGFREVERNDERGADAEGAVGLVRGNGRHARHERVFRERSRIGRSFVSPDEERARALRERLYVDERGEAGVLASRDAALQAVQFKKEGFAFHGAGALDLEAREVGIREHGGGVDRKLSRRRGRGLRRIAVNVDAQGSAAGGQDHQRYVQRPSEEDPFHVWNSRERLASGV